MWWFRAKWSNCRRAAVGCEGKRWRLYTTITAAGQAENGERVGQFGRCLQFIAGPCASANTRSTPTSRLTADHSQQRNSSSTRRAADKQQQYQRQHQQAMCGNNKVWWSRRYGCTQLQRPSISKSGALGMPSNAVESCWKSSFEPLEKLYSKTLLLFLIISAARLTVLGAVYER